MHAGAAPNQQLEPALDYLLRSHGTQFYLFGSDYVRPGGCCWLAVSH
jgi:urea transport system substrate-binding protein